MMGVVVAPMSLIAILRIPRPPQPFPPRFATLTSKVVHARGSDEGIATTFIDGTRLTGDCLWQ